MPQTNYVRGRIVEYKARDLMAQQGIFVIRAAASKTCVDLVGIHPVYGTSLVQLKRSKVPIKSKAAIVHAFGKDIQKLREIPCNSSVYKEIWLWIDYQGFRRFAVLPHGEIEIPVVPPTKRNATVVMPTNDQELEVLHLPEQPLLPVGVS